MKKISATLISLALLTTSSLFAGEVYRVVNEDGEITFTDSPAANVKAEALDMPKTNIAVAPPPSAKKTTEGEAAEDDVAYTSARIVKPSNNATIPPGQREVAVQLAFKPSLQPNHLVQLYIDGQKQGSPSASSSFTITSLSRGQHSVRAEVIGADKKRKITTQTVTINVKQNSSNFNTGVKNPRQNN